jgi:hypothetical protein
MSWAGGVRYSATAPLPRDPFVRTATTLLCGAALLLVASLLTGELARVDVSRVPGRSLLGLGYTYVNPLIAVLLGWAYAGEPLTPLVLGATGLILAAVVIVKSDASRRQA